MSIYDKKWLPEKYSRKHFRYISSSSGKLIIIKPTEPKEFILQRKILKNCYCNEQVYLKDYLSIDECYVYAYFDDYGDEDSYTIIAVDETIPNQHFKVQQDLYNKEMVRYNKEYEIYQEIAPIYEMYVKNKKAIENKIAKEKKLEQEKQYKESRRQQFLKLQEEFKDLL